MLTDLTEVVYCHAVSTSKLADYCHHCLARSGQLKRCVACRLFHYCGAGCQQADWKLHKTECSIVKELEETSLAALTDSIRLVIRLALKWARGEFGEIDIDGVSRSVVSTEEHSRDASMEKSAEEFLASFKALVTKRIVGDDVIKRLYRKSCINSFGVTNQFGTSIGVALCIKMSLIDHSCKPRTRMAYRGRAVQMMPTNLSEPPRNLADAQHSYIEDLLPLAERRKQLMEKYKFFCECDGCLDGERNDRMEAWRCEECADGWMPAREETRCVSCGRSPAEDHVHMCLMAVESVKAGNAALQRTDLPEETKNQLADKLNELVGEAFYEHNVYRLPILRQQYQSLISDREDKERLAKAAEVGRDLLDIHKQYRGPNDIAVCHVKYGLAQVYKLLERIDDVRSILSPDVLEVFGRAYGADSEVYKKCEMMLKA